MRSYQSLLCPSQALPPSLRCLLVSVGEGKMRCQKIFFPQIKQNYNQLTSTSVLTRWAIEQNPKSAEERQAFSAAL